jgi:SAM-dependent methyltransferase
MNEYTWKEKLQIIKQSLKMIGFWMTLRYVCIYLLTYLPNKDTRFDRRHGTDTSGAIYSGDLSIAETKAKNNAIFYLSAPASVTTYMLTLLNVDYEDFTFIDFGSGKGRALLVASEFPFKKIIGIEISQILHGIAKHNVERYHSPTQRCVDVELHCMDARAFSLPKVNAVFHFYHPFLPEVLRPVLQNIGDSLREAPRRILILYLYHLDYVKSVFDGMPFLKLVKEVKCVNGQYNWALYENRC